MMDRSNSEKKFYDEIYIAFRNEMEEYEEDLKRVEAVGENKISDGFILIEGKKLRIEEKHVKKRICLCLPEGFTERQEKERGEISPAFRSEDSILFTNEEASIYLLFDFEGTKLEREEAEAVRDIACGAMGKLRPKVTIAEQGSLACDLSPVEYYGFISNDGDFPIYKLCFFFALDGRLVTGSFCCLEMEYPEWKEIVKQILGTINRRAWEEG